MVLSRTLLTAVVVMGASPARAQEPAFTSGNIKLQVNRAFKPRGDGSFSASFVLSATREHSVEAFAVRTRVISDQGNVYESGSLVGIPVCRGTLSDCERDIAQGSWLPLTIEPGQGSTITLAFNGGYSTDGPYAADRKACSMDLSMPLYVRSLTGRTPGPWQLVNAGLPNIKVC